MRKTQHTKNKTVFIFSYSCIKLNHLIIIPVLNQIILVDWVEYFSPIGSWTALKEFPPKITYGGLNKVHEIQ